MRTAAEYGHRKPIAFQRISSQDADIVMLCLWAVLGFALTGLAFALGFGAEVVQALTAAG
jgi:hypothetical protein